jgi:hypothetical protein
MENTEDKGQWAEVADEGIVPDELGEDAPAPDDPELGAAVTGETTGSDEPTTEAGIDRHAGDEADATSDGGVELPEGAEPDLKDAMGAHQRPDADTGG